MAGHKKIAFYKKSLVFTVCLFSGGCVSAGVFTALWGFGKMVAKSQYGQAGFFFFLLNIAKNVASSQGEGAVKLVTSFLLKNFREFSHDSQYLSPGMVDRLESLLKLWSETNDPSLKILINSDLEFLKRLTSPSKEKFSSKVFAESIRLRLSRLEKDSSWPRVLKDILSSQIHALLRGNSTAMGRSLCLFVDYHNEALNNVLLDKISLIVGKKPLIIDCRVLKDLDVVPNLSANQIFSPRLIFSKLYATRRPGMNFIIIKNLDAVGSEVQKKAIMQFFQQKKSPHDPSIGDQLDFSQDLIVATTKNKRFVEENFASTLKIFDLNKNSDKKCFSNELQKSFLQQQASVSGECELSSEQYKEVLSFYSQHYCHKSIDLFWKSFVREFLDCDGDLGRVFQELINKKSKRWCRDFANYSTSQLLKLNVASLGFGEPILSILQSKQEALWQLSASQNTDIVDAVKHFKLLLKAAAIFNGNPECKTLREISLCLNTRHFGMDDLKRDLLSFFAMKQASGSGGGKTLLLVGPPGVGKTTIAQSIAQAQSVPFYKISCSGIINPSQLKGWPQSYKSAAEGVLARSLLQTQNANSVILLDEVDKLHSHNDNQLLLPLIEVLDPGQNKAVFDNYLEIEMDFSKAFFVLTANSLENLPTPLLDRCYIVKIPEYSMEEKMEIARTYLIPKIIGGLKEEYRDGIKIDDQALQYLVDKTAGEPSVRQLELLLNKLVSVMIKHYLLLNEWIDAAEICIQEFS